MDSRYLSLETLASYIDWKKILMTLRKDLTSIELENVTRAQEMAIEVVMGEGAMRCQDDAVESLQKELDAIIDLGERAEGYVDGFEHALLFLQNKWGMI